MSLSPQQRSFIEANPSCAMITVGSDGMAKPARAGLGFVGDRLVSSGTEDRVRTRRLRRDLRCTVFVFEAGYGWLGLEADVSILTGPEAIDLTVAFFRAIQHRPDGPLSWFGGEFAESEFRARMEQEGRILYEFEVTKAYGLVGM